ncbi:hypothetical protein CIB48_g11211 [Xylaria polymorpha]|nr:hypothetical protein CIB48_g11211 [Xylaria polymorpha]
MVDSTSQQMRINKKHSYAGIVPSVLTALDKIGKALTSVWGTYWRPVSNLRDFRNRTSLTRVKPGVSHVDNSSKHALSIALTRAADVHSQGDLKTKLRHRLNLDHSDHPAISPDRLTGAKRGRNGLMLSVLDV